MHRGLVVGLALLLSGLAVTAMVAGCGGHAAQAPPGPGPGEEANFVGQAVCVGCHTDVAAEYATQVHGAVNYGGSFRNKSVSSSRPLGVVTPGTSCNPCHVVGWEERSGFNPDGSTPHLEGIGCEECHGPGGNHAAAPSASNIIKVGDARETCYDCHVPSYKILDGIVPPTTDADLAGRAPASVAVHHPQAILLEGVLGYEMPTMPSPHTQVQNQCIGCHLNPTPSTEHFAANGGSGRIDHGAEGLEPDPITCAPCHGGERGAVAVFEHFEEETLHALIELVGEDPANPGHPIESVGDFQGLVGAFATNHGIDPADNSNPDDPNVKKLKGAIYMIDYIIADKSKGAHNPEFCEAMLDKANDLLD